MLASSAACAISKRTLVPLSVNSPEAWSSPRVGESEALIDVALEVIAARVQWRTRRAMPASRPAARCAAGRVASIALPDSSEVERKQVLFDLDTPIDERVVASSKRR
jgi:hypothetical protein